MAKVAFNGLGLMGSRMAARLLAAGHEVRVFNRTPGKAAELLARGAVRADSPRDAAEDADAVFSMVADDGASRAIWLGPAGVLAARLRPGAFAIECSTLSHAWVRQLSQEATTRGLRYLDAPVTGLPDDAAAGGLTLLVGAEADALESARPLLEALAGRIIRFGATGAGTAYKLIINMIGAVQIASAAECMALTERAGLDPNTVVDAVSTGQAASPQVVRNVRRIAGGDHRTNVVFTPTLRLKDVDYALQLARELGLGAPFGELSARLLRELCARGYADLSESALIEVARTQPLEGGPVPAGPRC
jgi:3-hydroxyisobutyrate dehydrogenase